VFRGPNGAASGVAAQHSQCFGAWYSQCPGLKVMQYIKLTTICLNNYLQDYVDIFIHNINYTF
jgi:hypothetical protein